MDGKEIMGVPKDKNLGIIMVATMEKIMLTEIVSIMWNEMWDPIAIANWCCSF